MEVTSGGWRLEVDECWGFMEDRVFGGRRM